LASTYTYRLLKSSWGILVSITAEVRTGQGERIGAVPLGDDVFLVDGTSTKSLSQSAMEMLIIGLKPLAAEIAHTKEKDLPVQIIVTEIRYNDSDFQIEGLAAAISGWAIAEFGLTQRDITVSFDREGNRYLFELPEL
jgi:hypothetical protein